MNNLRKDDYCHICKEPLKDYPSNGEPLVHGVVCKACNFKLVLPIRWLMRVHHALVNSLPLYYESDEDILRPVLSIPEINTSYQWSDRKNIRKLCEIFNEKNDQYLIEKFMQGFEGRIGNDVYFTLVLATKLLTKIIFPHIKEIIGEKEKNE